MTSHPKPSTPRTNRIARVATAAGVAGLGLLTLAGCAIEQAQADDTAASTSETSGSGTTGTTAAGTSTYADGTYNAEAQYQAPSGLETVSVTITLADDVVTAVTATGDATDHEAAEFQERFASSISAEVVGRDIADLSVSRVSGASLTSNGFNAALEQIRSEALA